MKLGRGAFPGGFATAAAKILVGFGVDASLLLVPFVLVGVGVGFGTLVPVLVYAVVAAGAGALGGRRLVAELGSELLKLRAEGSNLARRGVFDLVGFLSRQHAHVAQREGTFAVHLLRDSLRTFVDCVRHHRAFDALVFLLALVLDAEEAGGLRHEPVDSQLLLPRGSEFLHQRQYSAEVHKGRCSSS